MRMENEPTKFCEECGLGVGWCKGHDWTAIWKNRYEEKKARADHLSVLYDLVIDLLRLELSTSEKEKKRADTEKEAAEVMHGQLIDEKKLRKKAEALNEALKQTTVNKHRHELLKEKLAKERKEWKEISQTGIEYLDVLENSLKEAEEKFKHYGLTKNSVITDKETWEKMLSAASRVKELDEFMSLCEEFIVAEKRMTRDIEYTETTDMNYLYRFISSSTNAWEVLAQWKKLRGEE